MQYKSLMHAYITVPTRAGYVRIIVCSDRLFYPTIFPVFFNRGLVVLVAVRKRLRSYTREFFRDSNTLSLTSSLSKIMLLSAAARI